MRIDTYSGGRRTNKTTRAWNPRGRKYTKEDLPAADTNRRSTKNDRAPIPSHMADRYLMWMNTQELPTFGSTTKWRAFQRMHSSIAREDKKREARAMLRFAVDDFDLNDILPRKAGFEHCHKDYRW